MPTSGHLEDYINGLTEESSPDTTNDMLLIRDATDGSLKKIAPDNLGAGGGGASANGWTALGQTLAYGSADDPTYTATCTGVDLTSTLSVGMKLRVSQSTGGTKYFIITAIAFSTDTTITLYGGTDYNLENEAISSPNYSVSRAPYGFPLDPTKWTVEVTDTTVRTQSSPTQNAWYNLGSVSISIPIGVWRTIYRVALGLTEGVATMIEVRATLSTANNTESDSDFTTMTRTGIASRDIFTSVTTEKSLAIAAKTSYYLNSMTNVASIDTLFNDNAKSKAIIRAICAYL